MLKLTEMLFAKLCMAENKKVSDSPIYLEYDEREKHDSNVTLHKVQALFKDGLAIPNIKIRKVSRKNGNERYNGVACSLDDVFA
jgi:hypothetical protein